MEEGVINSNENPVDNSNIWDIITSESINLDINNSLIEEQAMPKKKKNLLGFFKQKKENEDISSADIPSLDDKEITWWDGVIVWSDNDWLKKENSIFEDLWDLNFFDWDEQVVNILEKKGTPLELWLVVSSYVFYILVVINFLFFTHLFIKTTDSDIITSIPGVCSYVWSSIDWYDNTDCKTFPKIVEDMTNNKNNLEQNIVNGLSILIPYKIKLDYILSAPEVKFILDKKSGSNVSFTKIMTDFDGIRLSSWWFNWKNIECSNFSFDKKWIMSVSCDFYWSSINEWASSFSSARWVAIDFLKNLQSKNSNFQVMNYPKKIDITKFNSADWIKALFFTKTTINLNLKYNLSSK